jgi:hypothetical protein
VDRAKYGGFAASYRETIRSIRARCLACVDEVSMSTVEYSRKLDELDRLLNDPDVPIQPDRIWSLLADVSRHEGEGMCADPHTKVGQGTVTCGMRR